MSATLRLSMRAVVVAILLECLPAATYAQAPAPTPVTGVLVALTIKPEAARPDVMKVLPEEVRATVKLYLEGRIAQWYSRADGRGVLFIVNATSAADAKAAMDTLPLSKSGLATFEFTPLGPLSPLRLLLAEPPAAPSKGDRQR